MSSAAAAWVHKEEEDKKPVIKPGVHITLKVQDTEGRAVYRTMRRTEKLRWLMDLYYANVPAVPYGTGRFLCDGRWLRRWQTPAELEMEDGDEVDFLPAQFGGPAIGSTLPHLSIAEKNKAVEKPQFITLKVVDQRQNLIRHTMRTTDKLQAVMDVYYSKVPGVDRGTGTFWFEAVCLHRDRTPAQLEMEDGDLIDFFDHQDGGGGGGSNGGRWMSAA